MEPDFPVELLVNENPRSLQGGARGLGEWKIRLAARLRQRLPEMAFLTDAPVRFVLRWFPDGEDFADLERRAAEAYRGLAETAEELKRKGGGFMWGRRGAADV